MFQSLEQVRRTLRLTVNNPSLFSLINTRLILRTGLDLAEIKPADNTNRDSIEKVVSALTAMGFQIKPDAK